jgi:uncharacterized protein (TIGR00730 family)
MKSICVFCASSPGAHPEYVEAARAVGGLLARSRITVVYGGGKVGLMGALADAALDAGGRVIGVIPHPMVARELQHDGTDLRVVSTMHERKQLMHELSDAFLILPGGFGTLEEMFETLTWAQLGMHDKPCGLLDVRGYWQHLVRMLDHAVNERLLRAEHRALLLTGEDPEELLVRMASFSAPPLPKWISSGET